MAKRRRLRFLVSLSTLLGIAVWSSAPGPAAGAARNAPRAPVGRLAARAASTLPAFGEPTISGVQGNGFEQGLQVDPSGRIYTSVPDGIGTAASFVWRSLDGGATFKWVPAGAPLRGNPPVCTQGGDTDLATDTAGHLYFIDLSAANFAAARSEDQGVTFTPPNCTSVETTPDDRQWYVTDGDPTNGGNLYLAYNVVAGSGVQVCQGVDAVANQLAIARSPAPGAPGSTAGVQFGPSLRVTGPCDEGIMGNDVVSPTTHHIFVIHPNNRRNAIRIARCQDVDTNIDPSGLSCVDKLVTTFPTSSAQGGSGFKTGANFPTLAVDTAGNLYAVWEQARAVNCGPGCGRAGDVTGDALLYWSSSTDEGDVWTTPVQIPTPGLHNNVFAWVDAGDPGRADIAWYGTDCTVKACEDLNNRNAGPDSVLGDWSLYFTQTLNGLDATPSFLPPVLAGEHFIHRGSMFTLIGGQSGDRALGDFLKLGIGPDGEAMISYSDSNNGSAGDLAPHAMFVRQIGGTGVFASKTVSGPAPPRNSVTDPAGDGKYGANGQVTANIPNLDVLSSSITRPDATHYRIKMTVADLRSLAPPGPPDSDTDLVWLTQWLVPSSTDPGGGKYFFAYMESTGGGAPSFFDGVAHSTNDFYVTYPGKNQVTGSFTPTAPGTITIDVPAADVGEAGPISNTLFSVTASAMTLQQPANSCPINPTNGEGGCLFNLIDLTPAYDSVPSKSVVGHAHTDYSHNGKAGPGDVHVIASSPTPEFVEYWDLRKNPPGPAGSNIRCGGPPSAVTRVSQDTIEIDGKISFCRSLSRAKTYRLIVSDGGPNPPNRDHYDMTLFGPGGGVVYHNADFTTVGLGDLAVT